MSRIIIKDAQIIDAEQETASSPKTIVIEQGIFTQVLDSQGFDKQQLSEEDVVIDGANKFVLPGLIDCHAHPCLADTNLSRLAHVPPTLMAARASRILNGMLMRGFTTIRDATGADWGIKQAVEDGEIIGSRLFIAGRALSQTGGHGDMRARTEHDQVCSCSSALGFTALVVDGCDDVRRAVREELRQGVDQIKIFVSGGVSSPHDPLECDQYSRQEIRTAVEEATRRNTYVMAHAYQASAIKTAVEEGVRTIEHGNLIDKEAAELMAEKGAFLVPTTVTYTVLEEEGIKNGWTDAMLDKLKVVKDASLQSLELCREAGVEIGFGTDLLGDSFDHQSREFIVRSDVESFRDTLLSATKINAKIVKQEGKLGVIQENAIADLLMLDSDPFEDQNVLQDQGCHMPLIIKAGEVVKNTLTESNPIAQ